jgi:putative hydrolase of the HAD superfamily
VHSPKTKNDGRRTKKYSHVFFDLDHTLWDFESNSKAAIAALFVRHELNALVGADADAFFTEYSRINEHYWGLFHRGEIDRETLRYIRFRKTLEHFRCVIREGLCDALAHDYIELLPVQNHLLPGALDTLDYLSGKYELHLITNGFEKVQMQKISRSGLHRYFKHVITSENAGFSKPQKEIFDYALRLSGATLENSIFIGDSPEADIQGAINAGMDHVHYNPFNKPCDITAMYCINDLVELKTLL